MQVIDEPNIPLLEKIQKAKTPLLIIALGALGALAYVFGRLRRRR